jgi:SAM-dependent methyltransferase
LQLVDLFKPQSIIETGTWSGKNAARMIKVASQYHDRPYYIGYDLFEKATDETDEEEFNVKPHHNEKDVLALIEKNCPNAEVALVKGNTKETLNYVVADLAFIDGGHSLETIEHDYEALKHCGVIIFDDHYGPDEDGKMPNIHKMGCNKIVEKLPHVVIEGEDRVEGGGRVNLAVVFGEPR